MADPVIISQIITSMGLSGAEAETKRQELEKLSDGELNKLLSNMTNYAPTDVGSFAFLSPADKFSGNVFNPGFTDNSLTSFSSSPAQKEYTSAQKKELDEFLGDFLFNSASSGYQTIKSYNDSVGWFNITDRVVNGFKVLTGQQDRIDMQEQMSEEMIAAKKLKDTAYSRPGAFESQFERKFGVPYSHANVEQLKMASEEFTRVSAYHDKTELLKKGFNEVRNILQQEQEYEQARKHVQGPAAASLQPPEVSSHEKFGEVLLQLCNGDQNLVNEYMKQLTTEMGNRNEIEKNLPKIMDELLANCQAQEKQALGNKTYSQYQQEYETACKKVFGTKDYKDTAQNFVENAKTQAAYTEVGLTIAASILLPQSSVVRGTTQKLALKYGEQAAANMVKGTMTAATATMPATLATLNAATSESGFTPEAVEEIKEKFKNGLMYGGFGAYVSSPLGLAVEKVLSKNPTMLSGIVSKTMGTAAETSADVLFDRMTSDLSFTESLKQNGVMNFGMMIAGGQVNRALSKLSVTKGDNGYTVKDETGKEIFKAEDENALAGFVMAKGMENAPAKNTTVNIFNQSSLAQKPIGNTVNLEKLNNSIREKLTSSQREAIPPDVVDLQIKEFNKLFEKYPDIDPKLIVDLIDNPNLRMHISGGKIDYNMFADVLKMTSKYPKYQNELLAMLKNEQYYFAPIMRQLRNPKFEQIADIVGVKDALSFTDTDILSFGIGKFESLNTVINGTMSEDVKSLKSIFKQKTGIDLHFDNNIDINQAKEYIESLDYFLQRYKLSGKTPPKQIYITSMVPKDADGVAWARKYPDVIAVRPRENKEWFQHCLFHESVHLTDMVNKRHDLQYKPVGTKLGIIDGEIVPVINQQEAEALKNSITKYIGNYAGYDTNEFTAEFGSMLLENKIIINEIEVNGDIQNEVIIKEPFVNCDGKTIEVTPEVRAEIERIVEYYFSVGGQNFPNANIEK